ncbi:hypothetical protein [Pedobacter sp. KLB.chiD]|uniref:hypothetical protein n=1 Tax=Pedobacter sp. KLB.chiD TaxID=3387402 RepID=UPI00399AF9A9
MKTSKNTALLIGGTAGTGLEIAKQLTALDNHLTKIYKLLRQLSVDALNIINANRKAWIGSVER